MIDALVVVCSAAKLEDEARWACLAIMAKLFDTGNLALGRICGGKSDSIWRSCQKMLETNEKAQRNHSQLVSFVELLVSAGTMNKDHSERLEAYKENSSLFNLVRRFFYICSIINVTDHIDYT